MLLATHAPAAVALVRLMVGAVFLEAPDVGEHGLLGHGPRGTDGLVHAARPEAAELLKLHIDDSDLSSRSTFALLTRLVALQSGGAAQLAPVLTLPVSR